MAERPPFPLTKSAPQRRVTTRRFPPPWTIDEANGACFIVKDHNGQALAYVYFENEPGRRAGVEAIARTQPQHMVHYTRYPIPEVPPVPVYISGYDDMLDQLIADVSNALMPVRRED